MWLNLSNKFLKEIVYYSNEWLLYIIGMTKYVNNNFQNSRYKQKSNLRKFFKVCYICG